MNSQFAWASRGPGKFSCCLWPGLPEQCNFDAAFRRLSAEYPGHVSQTLFTYLCERFHQLPQQGAFSRLVYFMPTTITNNWDNKRICALLMKNANCEAAFPPTFMTVSAALAATVYNPAALFYIKEESATRGAGIEVVTRDMLLYRTLTNTQIVQQAVQDIELFEGRKLVIRFYLLIHRGKAFLHRRGALVVHGKPYERNSTDMQVQVLHDHACDTANPSTKSRVIVMHKLEKAGQWYHAIADRLHEIMPALKPLIDASTHDTYALVGGDALIESTGQAKLLEFNFMPSMFTTLDDYNINVAQPVLRDVLAMVLLGESPVEFDELHQNHRFQFTLPSFVPHGFQSPQPSFVPDALQSPQPSFVPTGCYGHDQHRVAPLQAWQETGSMWQALIAVQ
eukprot:TRINITY_DN90415_c0_g1_i1.p1 TRINITY_DN90415_c0_g1~~TRINITY_DN90415_c0_g1_i1.p1  ORF type:complete len:395 (+),score=57.20 TRINITY_DN90415_c0_g1_i1:51-1235(+)